MRRSARIQTENIIASARALTSTHLAMPNMCAYVLQKTHAHNTIFEYVYTHFDDNNDDGDDDDVKDKTVFFPHNGKFSDGFWLLAVKFRNTQFTYQRHILICIKSANASTVIHLIFPFGNAQRPSPLISLPLALSSLAS